MMKNYVTLVAATLINICAGGIYAWSVVANALTGEYGYTNAQTQMIFGCCFMCNSFAMLITGKMQSKYGPGKVAFVGGVLIAVGYYCGAKFSDNYLLLLISVGIVVALGISCCYISALSSVSSVFERRSGVASGVVVAGYGFGAIVLSWVFNFYLKHNANVSEIFLKLSPVYGVVILLSSLLLPSVSREKNTTQYAPRIRGYLKDKRYVSMIVGMFCCSFSGLLIIGNLKSIGLNFGLTSEAANLSIVLMAIGNSSGRIVWGAIFDRFYSKSLVVMMVLLGFGILGLCFLRSMVTIYLVMTLLIASCFGGCFSMYPSSVTTSYGKDLLGVLYPPIIVFHGLACLIAAPLGGYCYDISGSFSYSLVLAFFVVGVAAVVHFRTLHLSDTRVSVSC